MALRLRTDRQIDSYVSKVITDALHHAPGVAKVIKPLADAVRSRVNLSIDRIEVYQRNGNIARTCWVTVGSKRYAFTYNYSSGMIDLRADSLRGAVLFQFDNRTSQPAILKQALLL